ncbi:MAG: phospho-N-acetylmuramoyl-pentapeptide-transferase [Candidatus Marinimicrobia bacterium]|nr:phospho-N-acetylmuramoyl-pentapeptide-transferase [Candidatus Neomarinimicrobiota bacterium]MCF7829622.1 phospho-N-acetylmuramoyl-pentapeptide-transferase [Candidatus Neomarinimicrobiota bacterium]MCF7879782.1 phospho-N-acetylmuramoyl-pentapeptide-transferase [Candidatus Neomarinimicrobiota bacterium]
MLYHLLYPLRDYISGLNIFQYITFRAGAAAITALFIAFILGPWIIRKLHHYKIGEEIRKEGPETHYEKHGTPTMGGIIILAATIIPTLLFANLTNTYITLIFIATIWMGLIGFLDDYLKVVKKYPDGLVAKYKLLGQFGLGIVIGTWIYLEPAFAEFNTVSTVPFFKNLEIDFGVLYIPIVAMVIAGTSNAVNLTDGLDGLASGLLAISVLAFAVIAYLSGRVDFSDYLNIIYLPGIGELTVYCAALMGALLGFLWFNANPAMVFMGDTGALAGGAALGTIAVLVRKELLLVIIGGIFVAEALSVILQTGYFRWTKRRTGTGKRLFRMAPLHHHFELRGWKENQVVVRFWIIGILLALLSLTTFKIR